MADQSDKVPAEGDVDFEDCDSDASINETSKKRKASPLDKPHLKRFSTASSKHAPKSKGDSVPDKMLAAFEEPSFLKKAAPLMSKLMEPTMQGFINKAVETAVGSAVDGFKRAVVDSLVSSINDIKVSNAQLLQSVNKQQDLINKQQGVINSQKEQIKTQADKIKSLEDQVNDLVKETHSLKLGMNKLEQYGRRNSIRIINLNIADSSVKSETQLKREIANFINEKLLPSEEPISIRDIDRCHAAGPKQILVKFIHYEDKNRVFYAKKKLKNHRGKVFITEDLTHYNHDIIKSLLMLKKAKKITDFWTRNGMVFFKKHETDSPSKLLCKEDLDAHGLD